MYLFVGVMWGEECPDRCVEVREQLSGIGSHLSSHGLWGWNSGVRLSCASTFTVSHLTGPWLLLNLHCVYSLGKLSLNIF